MLVLLTFNIPSCEIRVVVSSAIAFAFAVTLAVNASSANSNAATISANEFNDTSSVLFKILLICVCKPVSAASYADTIELSAPVARLVSATIAAALTPSAAVARATSFVTDVALALSAARAISASAATAAAISDATASLAR